MADEPFKKISMWRAGLRSFDAHWKEWFFLALIFFLIMVLLNFEMTQLMEPFQGKLAELKGQKDPHAVWAAFRETGPGFFSFMILLIIVVYVQHYMFFSFFMKKELPAESAGPTLREFFCYFSKNIQLMFVISLPPLAGMVISALLMKSIHAIAVIGVVASFLLIVFLMIRLYLAIPLAAAKIAKPIGNSWAITQGHFWRLLGNTLLITLIILGIYLAVLVVGLLLGLILGLVAKIAALPAKTVIDVFFRVVLNSGFSVYMSGMIAAYACAATRILYQEKRAADPNFVLTTRS